MSLYQGGQFFIQMSQCSSRKDFQMSVNIFTMVAEKFELQSYEMFQNEGFSNVTLNIFTMVEENFE